MFTVSIRTYCHAHRLPGTSKAPVGSSGVGSGVSVSYNHWMWSPDGPPMTLVSCWTTDSPGLLPSQVCLRSSSYLKQGSQYFILFYFILCYSMLFYLKHLTNQQTEFQNIDIKDPSLLRPQLISLSVLKDQAFKLFNFIINTFCHILPQSRAGTSRKRDWIKIWA